MKQRSFLYLALSFAVIGLFAWYRAKQNPVSDLIAEAEKGTAAAQCQLGTLYYKGESVPRNVTEALKWWRAAAEKGNAVAMNNLGEMYYKGEGAPRDFGEAVKWYRAAADLGLAGAQSNLGWMYYKGEGVPGDAAQAVNGGAKRPSRAMQTLLTMSARCMRKARA